MFARFTDLFGYRRPPPLFLGPCRREAVSIHGGPVMGSINCTGGEVSDKRVCPLKDGRGEVSACAGVAPRERRRAAPVILADVERGSWTDDKPNTYMRGVSYLTCQVRKENRRGFWFPGRFP